MKITDQNVKDLGHYLMYRKRNKEYLTITQNTRYTRGEAVYNQLSEAYGVDRIKDAFTGALKDCDEHKMMIWKALNFTTSTDLAEEFGCARKTIARRIKAFCLKFIERVENVRELHQ